MSVKMKDARHGHVLHTSMVDDKHSTLWVKKRDLYTFAYNLGRYWWIFYRLSWRSQQDTSCQHVTMKKQWPCQHRTASLHQRCS